MSAIETFVVLVFYISAGWSEPMAVHPTNVTLHEVNGQFSLEFDPIQFITPKLRNGHFFLGPEVTQVDNYLRANYGLALDTSAPLFEDGTVDFITDSSAKLTGTIGGIVYQPWYNALHVATYLNAGIPNDMITGMDAVTVNLPVVPLATALRTRSLEQSANPMRHYIESAIESYA